MTQVAIKAQTARTTPEGTTESVPPGVLLWMSGPNSESSKTVSQITEIVIEAATSATGKSQR
jgi:hypothetical protein